MIVGEIRDYVVIGKDFNDSKTNTKR